VFAKWFKKATTGLGDVSRRIHSKTGGENKVKKNRGSRVRRDDHEVEESFGDGMC